MTADRYDLEERLLEYAARIIRLTEYMTRSPAGLHVAQQILRSGTSALPNHGEAQAAESNRDFVHKLRICLKELRETLRWLVKGPDQVDALLQETDELVRIFVTSIKTARKNSSNPREQSKFGFRSSTFDVRSPTFEI